MSGFLDILGIGSKIIDKVIPDPQRKAEAKFKLAELHQQGEFKGDELRYEAITSEAKSDDKWTSRARPSFMYVIYILMLSSIPFSIYFAFDPSNAKLVVEGFKLWLSAIPNEMLALFGTGYVGYGVMRSVDKHTGGKVTEKIRGLFK